MKVSKIMTKGAVSCAPEDSLAVAAGAMFRRDCGMLPVVSGSKVVGAVTDRDIAIAASTRDMSPSQIQVSEVCDRKPVTCSPGDKVEDALARMSKERVRRLPVVGKDGNLEGVISLADILHASKRKKKLRKPVLKAARKISAPCPIVLGEIE